MSSGGITDEAAIEGHDLIHNAELEEERVCTALPPVPATH